MAVPLEDETVGGHAEAVAGPGGPAPVTDAEFAALMDRLGPFERNPRLAVAVSGGADSLALAVLCHRWARQRGGAITALIVDHGLRPESSQEAATVAGWLTGLGIAHVRLRWEGPKPTAGLQDAARAARRDILVRWCEGAGILHLLLGHHGRDQIETMMMRLLRGSGQAGLAGMSAVVEQAGVRLLRPLLTLAPDRLKATLRATGQSWVEDPTNRNPVFARTRMRAALPRLAQQGFDPDRLGALTQRLGRQRAAREAEIATFLARAVALHPEGWAILDLAAFHAAPEPITRPALAQLLLAVGGGVYPPRSERLDRLHAALRRDALGGGGTLAGCRLAPRAGGLFVVREAAAASGQTAIDGPGIYHWDDRFQVKIAGNGPWPVKGCYIARLGEAGWAAVAAADPAVRKTLIPPMVRPTLPALWDLDGVLAVPHLFYGRRGVDPASVSVVSTIFRPRQALSGPGFFAL